MFFYRISNGFAMLLQVIQGFRIVFAVFTGLGAAGSQFGGLVGAEPFWRPSQEFLKFRTLSSNVIRCFYCVFTCFHRFEEVSTLFSQVSKGFHYAFTSIQRFLHCFYRFYS